jgi:hypothetical protein
MKTDYDGNWYATTADDIIQRTKLNFIVESEIGGKKAFEILYETKVGRKLVRLAKPDKITQGKTKWTIIVLKCS